MKNKTANKESLTKKDAFRTAKPKETEPLKPHHGAFNEVPTNQIKRNTHPVESPYQSNGKDSPDHEGTL